MKLKELLEDPWPLDQDDAERVYDWAIKAYKSLQRIASSERLETGSFVCDFETLQNEARGALRDAGCEV